MRNLLGHSIDNASEHHSVINVRIAMSEELDAIMPMFEKGGAITQAQKEKQAIIDEIPNVFFGIKEKCKLMAERHEKAR